MQAERDSRRKIQDQLLLHSNVVLQDDGVWLSVEEGQQRQSTHRLQSLSDQSSSSSSLPDRPATGGLLGAAGAASACVSSHYGGKTTPG